MAACRTGLATTLVFRHEMPQLYTSPHFASFRLTRLTSPHFLSFSPNFASRRLTSPHFASLRLMSPHFASLRLTSPHFASLASLRLTSPHFASFRLTSPHFAAQSFLVASNSSQPSCFIPSSLERPHTLEPQTRGRNIDNYFERPFRNLFYTAVWGIKHSAWRVKGNSVICPLGPKN